MAHDTCGSRLVTWQWHMTTLDTQTWPREKVSGLGLIDKDVNLLRVVDSDILTMVDGDILAQGLIELIDRVLISTKCIFFS